VFLLILFVDHILLLHSDSQYVKVKSGRRISCRKHGPYSRQSCLRCSF